MPNFPLSKLKEAHDLWYKHNTRNNLRLIEREKEREVKKEESIKEANNDDGPFDMSDIDQAYNDFGRGPHLIELDWAPTTKTPSKYRGTSGETKYRWIWKHKLTEALITRFKLQGEVKWDTSKLYHYGTHILNCHKFPKAYDCYLHVRGLNNLKGPFLKKDDNFEVTVLGREALLGHQLKAVMYAVEANSSAASLHGPFAKRYIEHLDPRTKPPHRIVFMRFVRLLQQAVQREYKRIIRDAAAVFGSSFACTNSDFYTNAERRETFGCIVSNMQAKQFVMKVRNIDCFLVILCY